MTERDIQNYMYTNVLHQLSIVLLTIIQRTMVCIIILLHFPEYKSHILSRKMLQILDMQLILKCEEKEPFLLLISHVHGTGNTGALK